MELPHSGLHPNAVTPVIIGAMGGLFCTNSIDLASREGCSCRLSKGAQDSTDASRAAATASSQSSAQQNGGYGSGAQQAQGKRSRPAAQGQLTRADVEDAYSLFQVRGQTAK